MGRALNGSYMKTRYRLTTAVTAFGLVVLIGAVWVGMASSYAAGQSGLAITVLGAAFSAVFIWLLLTRLRSLLAHPERRFLEFFLLALNFSIMILTFAWVHHQIGLMDLSGPAPRPTSDLGDALYFSVVTSTTLGYGDFIPLGPGRPLAAIQALTGYTILGIIVSAGFQIIAPDADEDADDDADSGEDRQEKDSSEATEQG